MMMDAEAMKELLRETLKDRPGPETILPERADLGGLKDLADVCRALDWDKRPLGARELLRLFGHDGETDDASRSQQPVYSPRPGLWATRTPHYHIEIDESTRPRRMRAWFVRKGTFRLSLERYWIEDEWQTIQA